MTDTNMAPGALLSAFVLNLLFLAAATVLVLWVAKRRRSQYERENQRQPYEPSVVDKTFISNLSREKARGGTPEQRELADILRRWQPTDHGDATYDMMAGELLPILRAQLAHEADPAVVDDALQALVRVHLGTSPGESAGMANYTLNWWRSRPRFEL